MQVYFAAKDLNVTELKNDEFSLTKGNERFTQSEGLIAKLNVRLQVKSLEQEVLFVFKGR